MITNSKYRLMKCSLMFIFIVFEFIGIVTSSTQWSTNEFKLDCKFFLFIFYMFQYIGYIYQTVFAIKQYDLKVLFVKVA